MKTIPRIEERPDRFGSPLGSLEATPWEPLGDNVFECRVVLCPEDEGGYSAHAIRLPGVVSQGESVKEALANIGEAFRGAISFYREQQNGIPWANVEIDRPKGSLERWISGKNFKIGRFVRTLSPGRSSNVETPASVVVPAPSAGR